MSDIRQRTTLEMWSVSRDAANDDPQDKACDHSQQTDRERDGATVHDTRKHIPAQLVRPKEENGASLRDAKQVEIGLDENTGLNVELIAAASDLQRKVASVEYPELDRSLLKMHQYQSQFMIEEDNQYKDALFAEAKTFKSLLKAKSDEFWERSKSISARQLGSIAKILLI